jgi:hypothetical protein
MFLEFSELQRRVEKLKSFIGTEDFRNLPEIDRLDLSEQLQYMNSYLEVLSRRVSRQCGDA